MVDLLVLVTIVAGAAYFVFGGATAAPATAVASVIAPALEAQRGGAPFVPLLDGEVVSGGDKVRADANGRGFLTFSDGSTLAVEPGSQVAVTELSSHADGSLVLRVEQTLGRTWANVKKPGNPNARVEIKTPAATAMVRGTAWETIVLANLTTIIKTTEGAVLVRAQGVEREATAGMQVTTQLGQPPAAPQPQAPLANLRFASPAGTEITVFTPNGLACGGGRSDAPSCTEGSVILREVIAGQYTVLMRAAASVNATLTMEGRLGPTTVSTAAVTRAMGPGDQARTTVTVTLDAQGRPLLGRPTLFEVAGSVCVAEARGRVFSEGTVEERGGALAQFAAASKQGQSVAIVFNDAELTAALQRAVRDIEGMPVTITEARVLVTGAGLQLSAHLAAGPLSLDTKASVVAGAGADGKLLVRLRDLDLGPVGEIVRAQLAPRIEEAVASVAQELPLAVQRVAFRGGCLVLMGTTR